MPAPPPSTDELLALAERALARCQGEAQATARWTHELTATPSGARIASATVVDVAVVVDGRTGLVSTTDVDEDGLRRAARAAAALAPVAAQAHRGARLGEPARGRAHDGYDPRLLGLDPATAAAALAASPQGGGGYRAAATKLAVASSRGVRAAEQRSFTELRVRRVAPDGRALALGEIAVSPSELDALRLAAEADALLGLADGPPGWAGAEPGEQPVVLGPWAVAEVLRLAATAFAGPARDSGPLAGRFGARVVAPSVNLSDSPRYPATVPRSYDAEGVPRQPVPLIQDGVAHRPVHDSTSAAAAGTASTGHAALPGGLAAPRPDHLVLVGGGAAGLEALAATIDRGLLVPTLSATGPGARRAGGEAPDGAAAVAVAVAVAEGVRVIRDGRPAELVGRVAVTVEPFALLASVQALTATQRAVWPAAGTPAWAIGATVCPGLRAAAGLRVA
jgi:predicted Zn-dependent protease